MKRSKQSPRQGYAKTVGLLRRQEQEVVNIGTILRINCPQHGRQLISQQRGRATATECPLCAVNEAEGYEDLETRLSLFDRH